MATQDFIGEREPGTLPGLNRAGRRARLRQASAGAVPSIDVDQHVRCIEQVLRNAERTAPPFHSTRRRR